MQGKTSWMKGALIGFCLACVFFTLIQTRSLTENRYNTWADLNDDGIVNIVDVAAVAKAFGSEGDASKPANATNLWELDCYHRLSVESFIDRRHAAVGNREPVTCFILVSYQGVPVTNLTSENFTKDVISTPYGIPVEFTFAYEGEAGNGTGIYVFAIAPSFPVSAVWEQGAYIFIVNVYAKAVVNLNVSPKDNTQNSAQGVNSPNLLIT